MLKALAESSWGQDNEITADLQHIGEIYGKLCCTSLEHQSFKKIQTAQNAALRTAPGAYKMPVLTIFIRSPSR